MIKWLFRAVLLFFIIVIAWIIRDTYFVEIRQVDIVISALPPELDGYRILQISDFHGRHFSKDGSVAKKIAKEAPDIIVLTGDYVHDQASQIYNIYPLLEKMTQIAPVYAVSGNHDHRTNWRFIANALQEIGIEVLENCHVRLRKNGRTLVLAGVNDPYAGFDDLQAALPQSVNSPVILLAHAPTWFEPLNEQLYAELPVFSAKQELLKNVSLTLVGHTHGGQIKLPFIGAVTTASGQLFPKTHIEGLSREDNGWLYISRGIGQSGIIPLRFMSRAEITVITLRSADL